jgi:hypothetical protein
MQTSELISSLRLPRTIIDFLQTNPIAGLEHEDVGCSRSRPWKHGQIQEEEEEEMCYL